MELASVPQTAIDEEIVEDTDFEAALERRQELKEAASAAAKEYREADEQVRAELASMSLEQGSPVRFGRFVVSKTTVAGRSVSFETVARERLTIKLFED